MRVFEFIQDTVQDLIEEFEEDDPLYGTLTRTIMEDRIPTADGSDTYPVTAVEKIISELSAVMLTQFSVNNILRDMRFHVPVDLDKKYRSLQEIEFTQISSFSNNSESFPGIPSTKIFASPSGAHSNSPSTHFTVI